MKADLHIHSIYSDGDYTPAQIVDMAKEKNLELIALTDHDTVDGVKSMVELSKNKGLECFTGIELSAFSCREIHILGYNVDIYDVEFNKKLESIKKQRKERLKETINKLNFLGINITIEEVYLNADEKASVGRLHIAKTLIQKNVVKSVADAFDRLLGFGKTAYVPTFRLKTEEAIKIIKKAGGKAILAHPFFIDVSIQNLLPLITQLISYGIDGIEAVYYAHNKFENDYLINLARKLNIIATCGSDFHGDIRKSEICD